MTAESRTIEATLVELPADDPRIEELTAEQRGLACSVWLERASSELGAAQSFSSLSAALVGAGVHSDLLWLATRAASDEVRHAELCRRVALRYSVDARSVPDSIVPRPVARLGLDIPSALRLPVAVVATSCVSETLGAAYLESCLAEAESETAKIALRSLLRDEVDHARLGWAFVSRLPPALRAGLSERLGEVLAACLRIFEARLSTLPEVGLPAHGCPGRERARGAIADALDELVVSGFEHVGIEIART